MLFPLMGITHIDGLVRGPNNETATVQFLVDSGAQYSLLPHDVWIRLGLKSSRKLEFVLADGTRVERDVSERFIELPQGAGTSPVILGEEGDTALLGVVTLEILGLVLHPFSRTLHPMRMLMAGIRSSNS
jgi:clan AA aspartic protease